MLYLHCYVIISEVHLCSWLIEVHRALEHEKNWLLSNLPFIRFTQRYPNKYLEKSSVSKLHTSKNTACFQICSLNWDLATMGNCQNKVPDFIMQTILQLIIHYFRWWSRAHNKIDCSEYLEKSAVAQWLHWFFSSLPTDFKYLWLASCCPKIAPSTSGNLSPNNCSLSQTDCKYK